MAVELNEKTKTSSPPDKIAAVRPTSFIRIVLVIDAAALSLADGRVALSYAGRVEAEDEVTLVFGIPDRLIENSESLSKHYFDAVSHGHQATSSFHSDRQKPRPALPRCRRLDLGNFA